LIFMGIMFGVALVMMEAPSPMLIAVGMYLPAETTSAIFLGGIMKWAADRIVERRKFNKEARDQFENKGMLLASGFIAGEAITGVLLAVLMQAFKKPVTELLTGHAALPFLADWGGWLSLVAFAIIAWTLTVQSTRGISSAGTGTS